MGEAACLPPLRAKEATPGILITPQDRGSNVLNYDVIIELTAFMNCATITTRTETLVEARTGPFSQIRSHIDALITTGAYYPNSKVSYRICTSV